VSHILIYYESKIPRFSEMEKYSFNRKCRTCFNYIWLYLISQISLLQSITCEEEEKEELKEKEAT